MNLPIGRNHQVKQTNTHQDAENPNSAKDNSEDSAFKIAFKMGYDFSFSEPINDLWTLMKSFLLLRTHAYLNLYSTMNVVAHTRSSWVQPTEGEN